MSAVRARAARRRLLGAISAAPRARGSGQGGSRPAAGHRRQPRARRRGLLAGRAALRAGAGKLQIGTARSIAAPLAVAVPEARVIGHAETDDGCIAEDGIPPLIRWAKSAQAVAVGCGMQPGPPLERLLSPCSAPAAPSRWCSTRRCSTACRRSRPKSAPGPAAPSCSAQRRDGAAARTGPQGGRGRSAPRARRGRALQRRRSGQGPLQLSSPRRAGAPSASKGGVGLATSGSGDVPPGSSAA